MHIHLVTKSERGFTLVGAMIGFGLLSLLLMSVLDLSQTLARSVQAQTIQGSILQANSNIQSILSDPSLCATGLRQGVGPARFNPLAALNELQEGAVDSIVIPATGTLLAREGSAQNGAYLHSTALRRTSELRRLSSGEISVHADLVLRFRTGDPNAQNSRTIEKTIGLRLTLPALGDLSVQNMVVGVPDSDVDVTQCGGLSSPTVGIQSWQRPRALFHTTTNSCPAILDIYDINAPMGGPPVVRNLTQEVSSQLGSQKKIIHCSISYQRSDTGWDGTGRGGSHCRVFRSGNQWFIEAESWIAPARPYPPLPTPSPGSAPGYNYYATSGGPEQKYDPSAGPSPVPSFTPGTTEGTCVECNASCLYQD